MILSPLFLIAYHFLCTMATSPIESLEILDVAYYERLTYRAHYQMVELELLFPMMNGYSMRHFWHQYIFLKIALEDDEPYGANLLTHIYYLIMYPIIYEDLAFRDLQIDIDMISLLDALVGDIVWHPERMMSTTDFVESYRMHALDDVYHARLQQWFVPKCVVQIIARNYLIMLHKFLLNVRSRTIPANLWLDLHERFELTYEHLSHYDRFVECGDPVLHSNVLARVDIMFNADFLRNGVPIGDDF